MAENEVQDGGQVSGDGSGGDIESGGIAEAASQKGITETAEQKGIAEGALNADACGERRGADGKEAEGKAGQEQKPAADWALKAPEDFPIPEDNLKSFEAAAKKLGLSKEQAEGMIAWHKEFNDQAVADAERIRASTISQWQKEMKADPVFGGANGKATYSNAVKALGAFDTDGTLSKLLRESGYEWHPAVIRTIARVGEALGEHAFRDGSGAKAAKPLHERFYPNMSV